MKQTGVKDSFLKEKRDWVHDQLATWTYENVISFYVISMDSFLKACMAIGDYGPSYRPPASHIVDLMLESIRKLSLFKGAIEKARTLTVFIYSYHKTLSMMHRICDKRDIVRPEVTRFATKFLTLRSLLEKKGKLRYMFSDEEWVRCKLANSAKGSKVEVISMSDSWWTVVAKILKVYAPIFRLLRVLDSDYKLSMGFVVGILEDIKKEIIQVFKNKEKDFKPVINIIDRKSKDQLFSPLHMASYYLNPYYFYRDDVVKNCKRVKDGFLDVVELFYPYVEQQVEIHTQELERYREGKSSFSRIGAVKAREKSDLNPANWWYLHSGDCPFMQNMANKLLNLTSNSSGCERNWSTFEGIHTKKRNRLKSKRLEELIYVKFNLKLNQKNRRGENKNLLLSNDRSKERAWILEGAGSNDEEEVYPGSGLTWRMVEGISRAAENRRSSRLAGPSSASTSVMDDGEDSLISDDVVSDEEEDCVEMDSGEDSDDGVKEELHDDDDV
ncbi:uncharacterized protein LOC109847711 [Asparagus officinalis]|uniref:uncharacterized protein LOC109847711 n=1 Tax=Asparagus officinalis TaxID=4686 RepID=UPI00098DF50F|nr:uncharacterized protein LOC109847711 [Asparagus officinalis]